MKPSATTTTEMQAAMPTPITPLRMSYEEYLEWEYTGSLTEWVNGEVIIFMPPTDAHQNIVEFLHNLLSLFVRLFKLGKVRIAPFAMCALPDGPAREPDLFFLAAANLSRLTSRELSGPADLVIEVISDDSVARDRADKFYEYQEAGVREYWIIDPRPGKERVDFYVLDAHMRYQPVPIAADGTYHSTVLPNFWLKVDWLWTNETNPLAALAEIPGADQVIAALREEKR